MKRKELTEEELKIAEILSKTIERLDRIVFPENPIEVFVLQCFPPDEAERFGYCSEAPNFINDYSGELYFIFGGGLAERIEKEKQKSIMLFKDSELLKAPDQLPRLSLEEVLIILAVHEVRHRVYQHFPERFFSPQDWQNTNNEYKYLKRAFRYVELLCREIYTSSEEFKKEFDAAVIEHIVVEKWHYGRRNLSEIARIVKSGPSEFLNKFK